jgi:DNA-binding response OmpR family regulator
MDLNLPDMSGNEILRRLQSDPETQNISVVVISGEADQDGRGLLEKGASSYLTKPFDVRRLLEVVDLMLSRRVSAVRPEGFEPPIF